MHILGTCKKSCRLDARGCWLPVCDTDQKSRWGNCSGFDLYRRTQFGMDDGQTGSYRFVGLTRWCLPISLHLPNHTCHWPETGFEEIGAQAVFRSTTFPRSGLRDSEESLNTPNRTQHPG